MDVETLTCALSESRKKLIKSDKTESILKIGKEKKKTEKGRATTIEGLVSSK